MASQTFSNNLNQFNLIAEGITTRADSLLDVGVTTADADAMRAYVTELNALNAEQEELKAQLKAKTEAMTTKMKEAKTKYSNLRKRVKIAVPKEDWVAYGITAKR